MNNNNNGFDGGRKTGNAKHAVDNYVAVALFTQYDIYIYLSLKLLFLDYFTT